MSQNEKFCGAPIFAQKLRTGVAVLIRVTGHVLYAAGIAEDTVKTQLSARHMSPEENSDRDPRVCLEWFSAGGVTAATKRLTNQGIRLSSSKPTFPIRLDIIRSKFHNRGSLVSLQFFPCFFCIFPPRHPAFFQIYPIYHISAISRSLKRVSVD